jgi:hypothetical protein
MTKLGVPEEYTDKIASAIRAQRFMNPFAALVTGPSGADIQKGVEGVTGKFYDPHTRLGKYASTIAEYAPGAVLGGGGTAARVLNVVAPAIAAETAGQATEGTPVEPYARLAGGVLGGLGAAKAITPIAPATPARQAAVGVLEREGIPLTAGQRTGSKPLQWAESTAADMPGSGGRAASMSAAQKAAYDRAVTERPFSRAELTARGVPEDVNLPDPRVVNAGKQSLADEYKRLTQNELVSNPQLHTRLGRAESEYSRLVQPHELSKSVEQTRSDIVNRLVANQGRMAGDEYQSIRSQIGKAADEATNPQQKIALKEMQGALDEAMQAGLPPAEAKAWIENNRRYALMKQLEPAVAGAGENLSPARVAQTTRAGRNAQYAGGQGDLDELARAGSIVLKDLPQSGTGPRTGWQTLFNMPILVGGGAAAGSTMGPMGAAVGTAAALAPFAASRALLSRPVQAYLGNQALPQNARDIITQTLAEQAIAYPSIVRRKPEQERDKDK